MPFKLWSVGEEVIASDFNPNISQQVVTQWANAAARTAGIAAPVEGMYSFLRDVDHLEYFDGAAWQDVSVGSKGPRGEIAFFRQAADVGLPGGTQVNLNFGPSANLVQGRKYRATFYCQLSFTAAATVNLSIRSGTTPGGAPPATDILQRLTFGAAAGSFMSVSIIARWVHPYATGSYFIPIWGGTTAAATIVQGSGAFTDILVEDIGGT